MCFYTAVYTYNACVYVYKGERAAAEAEDDLREIMSEFWSWRLREVPEFASSVGVHDYDDRLETFTLEAFSNRKVKVKGGIIAFNRSPFQSYGASPAV